MAQYTSEEYADMIYVYGLCDGNASAAREEYGRRFSQRRLPHRDVFSGCYRRLRETGSVTIRHADNNPTGSSSADLEQRILAIVRNDPSTSLRALSLRLNVSSFTIWNVLRAEGLHPYHYTPTQELLPLDLPVRLEFCNWLLQRHLEDSNYIKNIMWTDECNFSRNGVVNFHNLHRWASENPHAVRSTSIQHRFSVNLWAGVLGNQIIGPFRLPTRLNSQNYLEFLRNEVDNFFDDIPLSRLPNIFYQHDGAPAHCGQAIKDWLNNNFPNRWIGRNGPVHWPARSPDLTILDFFVWGRMKALIYLTEVSTLADLNARIDLAAEKVKEELANINVGTTVCKRALACINSNGGHFEQLL